MCSSQDKTEFEVTGECSEDLKRTSSIRGGGFVADSLVLDVPFISFIASSMNWSSSFFMRGGLRFPLNN